MNTDRDVYCYNDYWRNHPFERDRPNIWKTNSYEAYARDRLENHPMWDFPGFNTHKWNEWSLAYKPWPSFARYFLLAETYNLLEWVHDKFKMMQAEHEKREPPVTYAVINLMPEWLEGSMPFMENITVLPELF